MTDGARAGKDARRRSYNRSGFFRSMLLGFSAGQALFGVVLMVTGAVIDVWYVAMLGAVTILVGTLIFVDTLTDDI